LNGLREHLQVIYDAHGELTPELVVQTARRKSHPLHPVVFDRPVTEAAEAWYRERAHELIQSVRVVYREADENGPEKSVRAFHAIRRDSGYVYEPVQKVAEDPFARRLLLNDMRREWEQFKARYETFEEFLSLVQSFVNQAEAA
jgi:hypothetical protein